MFASQWDSIERPKCMCLDFWNDGSKWIQEMRQQSVPLTFEFLVNKNSWAYFLSQGYKVDMDVEKSNWNRAHPPDIYSAFTECKSLPNAIIWYFLLTICQYRRNFIIWCTEIIFKPIDTDCNGTLLNWCVFLFLHITCHQLMFYDSALNIIDTKSFIGPYIVFKWYEWYIKWMGRCCIAENWMVFLFFFDDQWEE